MHMHEMKCSSTDFICSSTPPLLLSKAVDHIRSIFIEETKSSSINFDVSKSLYGRKVSLITSHNSPTSIRDERKTEQKKYIRAPTYDRSLSI